MECFCILPDDPDSDFYAPASEHESDVRDDQHRKSGGNDYKWRRGRRSASLSVHASTSETNEEVPLLTSLSSSSNDLQQNDKSCRLVKKKNKTKYKGRPSEEQGVPVSGQMPFEEGDVPSTSQGTAPRNHTKTITVKLQGSLHLQDIANRSKMTEFQGQSSLQDTENRAKTPELQGLSHLQDSASSEETFKQKEASDNTNSGSTRPLSATSTQSSTDADRWTGKQFVYIVGLMHRSGRPKHLAVRREGKREDEMKAEQARRDDAVRIETNTKWSEPGHGSEQGMSNKKRSEPGHGSEQGMSNKKRSEPGHGSEQGISNKKRSEPGHGSEQEGNHSHHRVWDKWGKWSKCTVTCGVGKLVRWRHCMGGSCASGEKEAQLKTCTNPAC